MKSLNSTYIVSGQLDHKENHQLTEDISLKIEKQWETNLRERNPQIATIEAVPADNPLNLEVGDKVIVHHFTFYGDIASDKGYQLQEHFNVGDKKLFKALCRQILFKMNNDTPEMVGSVLLCLKSIEETFMGDVYLGEREFVKIAYGNDRLLAGTEVILEPHALYPIDVNGTMYYKIFENEVVATVVCGEAIAYDDTIVVKDIESKKSVIELLGKSQFGYSRVVEVGSRATGVQKGDVLYNWVQQGLNIDGKRLINEDNIIGIAQDYREHLQLETYKNN